MKKHVVFLLHGIRTQAEWAQRAAQIIESDPSMVARPIRYGFFDVVRFLLPFQKFRDRPIDRITRLLRDEFSRQPQSVSVIAHSFGTYVLSKIIEREHDIKFNRIILCGSIVREDFEWEKYGHRIGADASADWQLVCDCGMRDVWPVLAHTVTWGYGSSGRFGFGHPRVKDRFFNLGHSGFFTRDFIKKYWLPYLSAGTIESGEIERATTPWWLSIATVVKIRWIIVSALAATFLWHAYGYLPSQREIDGKTIATDQAVTAPVSNDPASADAASADAATADAATADAATADAATADAASADAATADAASADAATADAATADAASAEPATTSGGSSALSIKNGDLFVLSDSQGKPMAAIELTSSPGCKASYRWRYRAEGEVESAGSGEVFEQYGRTDDSGLGVNVGGKLQILVGPYTVQWSCHSNSSGWVYPSAPLQGHYVPGVRLEDFRM